MEYGRKVFYESVGGNESFFVLMEVGGEFLGYFEMK